MGAGWLPPKGKRPMQRRRPSGWMRALRLSSTLGLAFAPPHLLWSQPAPIADAGQQELGEFYEKSWLLVHFLRLGHRADEYPDLRGALRNYLQQPEAGFAASFCAGRATGLKTPPGRPGRKQP